MKNMPLALQIWLVCVGISGLIVLMLVVFLPWTLNQFFTRQVFDMLADSQPAVGVVSVETATAEPLPPDTVNIAVSPGIGQSKIDSSAVSKTGVPSGTISVTASDGAEIVPGQLAIIQENYKVTTKTNKVSAPGENITFSVMPVSMRTELPSVQHLVFSEGSYSLRPVDIPEQAFNQIKAEAQKQKGAFKEYSRQIGEKTLFYVIRKSKVEGQPVSAITYSWGTYRNSLVKTMYWQLLILMIALAVLSWLPSMGLARYLTRPLTQMEAETARIAEHDWHEPFELSRRDEIGKLARAFEQMRQRLIRQDETQRSFLQNVSHELKTPVMVIRSYAQSLLDGVYPRGSQEASVQVIINEAERLENRIKDLMYLNKLNYLSSHEQQKTAFDLSAAVSECIERFRLRRPELEWNIDIPSLAVIGDRQQWEVGLENLIDNQIRHAGHQISITASVIEPAAILLQIWNDGSAIDPELMPDLFEPFSSGKGGEFGLGLAILKRVADLNGALVWAKNELQGVSFYLQIPCGQEGPGL